MKFRTIVRGRTHSVRFRIEVGQTVLFSLGLRRWRILAPEPVKSV